MEEIEVKFLNVDPATLQKRFAEIGAKKTGEYFYRRFIFDYPDWRLDKKGSWLRLRDEVDRVTLTFKQRLGVTSDDGSTSDTGMEETEIVVSDFDKTASLLLKVGFIEKRYQENKRIRWEKDGIEFDIDTYPNLAPYLEIEAPSWEKIDEAMQWLNLNPADKKIFSVGQVYALNGINEGDYQRVTFDGMVKRPGDIKTRG